MKTIVPTIMMLCMCVPTAYAQGADNQSVSAKAREGLMIQHLKEMQKETEKDVSISPDSSFRFTIERNGTVIEGCVAKGSEVCCGSNKCNTKQ